MTFNPYRDPVDYILLAGEKSPGVAIVSEASSPRQWDERKGFARSGARVVFRGIGLSHFTVTLRLASESDFDAWEAWKPLVDRPPVGERARAKDIWHPILEDLGISSVVVEEVIQPTQNENGIWDAVIRFIEYRRPVRILEPIEGSEEVPTPLSEDDLVIRALTGQLTALGDELEREQSR